VTEKMKEMMEFPVLYTFKAMGENSTCFIEDVRQVFVLKNIDSFIEKPSSKGNYISVSVTLMIHSYEELQNIYQKIKLIKGLKYHL